MKTPLKEIQTLRRHIIALASLPETHDPVISAYFDLTDPVESQRFLMDVWASGVRRTFTGERRASFESTLAKIRENMTPGLDPGTRGLAIFARSGDYPLLMVIPLGGTMESSFHSGPLPVIFPLVQTQDRFHRFVAVISTEESARICEITLGSVSEELLATTPGIRERIGREWTREHYHHQKRERDRRFLHEKVEIIDRLMSRRGHNHLILAGHPRFIKPLREALPKRWQECIVGEVPRAPNGNDASEVLNEVIQAFVNAEFAESVSNVERLHEEVRTGGLAVLGIDACLPALTHNVADMLVISENLDQEDREELVRLASTRGISIEVCEEDPLLDDSGGVGCLLRYKPDYAMKTRTGAKQTG